MIFNKNKVKRSLPRKIGNGIIAFFVGIFFLLILFFAFSQTSSFRNMLRTKIIEVANNSLNGRLNIGKLEGTLITHLVLRDVSLENNLDTLVFAKKIEVAVNPFYILAKRIKVTQLKIIDANISLLELEDSVWNYTDLVKSDTTFKSIENIEVEENDSTGGFPLLIDLSNFSLQNISFKMKRNQYLSNHVKYKSINYDDLEFENLNLNLDLLADIKNNEFFVDISKLSFEPNIEEFVLNNSRGKIFLNEKFAEAINLSISTNNSDINLSARMDSLNVFGNVSVIDFKNYPIKFNLICKPLSAKDLSAFVESVNFMNGSPDFEMQGEGKFGDFNFHSYLKLDKTILNLDGNLTNLNTPSDLFIKAKFTDSQVLYNEVDNFLRDMELPKYPKLFVKAINLNFEGEPLKFKLDGKISVGSGTIKLNSFMDITKELIEYDYNIITHNLNLSSTLGIETKLNSKGILKGNGFDPAKSNSNMSFKIENSFVEGHYIDTAHINLQTIDKLINLQIYSQLDSMKNEISGKLDLASTDKPIYNLQGVIENLNLFNYTKDSTLISSLNFEFDINGHSLDLDKTEGEFKLGFNNSVIGSNELDSVNFQINLSKIDSTRVINFKSSFLDFNITGIFLLDETFNLLTYQTKKISYAILQKLNEINPVNFSADSTNTLQLLMSEKSITNKNIYLDYDFNFKDFKLIAALLNRDQFEVSGQGYGYLENNSENFTISTHLNLDWLFLFKGKEVFYISDVESGFDVGANNSNYSFDNIFGSFSLTSEQMVSDLNINNIRADLIFNQSKAFINAEANIQDIFDGGIEGFLSFSDSSENFDVSNLFLSYKDYKWQNRDSIYFLNTNSTFKVKNFNLFNDDSQLSINGSILNKANPDFDILLSNLDGVTLAKKLLDPKILMSNSIINAVANVSGTLTNPIINTDFSVENIFLKNNYLGSLFGKVDFKDNVIFTKIELLDTLHYKDNEVLTLNGTIPYNFDSELSEQENADSLNKWDLKFKANGFNISSFGNTIPNVTNPSGIVNSNISIFGNLNKLNYSGFFNANNIKFTSALTNLDYLSTVNLIFDKNMIQVKNSFVKNNGKTNYPGQMVFEGEIVTEGFGIDNADIAVNGNIALLSPFSQESSPNFFGDFQIRTQNTWHFKYQLQKPSFSGNILLEEVNLNFIPSDASYTVSNSDFRYIFISDTTSTDIQKMKQNRLLSALSKKNDNTETNALSTDFDFDIKIMSPNISKLSIVLSKALNQKLLADITGELRIKNIDNKFTSQGQFDILPSSMFTFYKTFSAEGDIKFTSDFTNPLITLTSTYIGDYINPRDPKAEPVKTGVKIKIDDSVKSLLANMASGKKPLDMRIYSGAQNIEYDVPNPQYTNLDAMYFIIFGTFSSDTENANIAKSAGYSMFGSLFTSMVNAKFGNIVNNVNINQTGQSTRFNVSGRYQKVRYTVGGTVEEISDWTQANAKLEYLFSPQFIMRVERKNSVISNSYNPQKINEFGVMYRFSF